MKPTEPLPLNHSWPLFASAERFNLGLVTDSDAAAADRLIDEQVLAARGIGRWRCDLIDNALSWSDAVYDVFALPRDARLSRSETVALYCEESRVAMERLRAHAIRHRRGFTLDAQILPAAAGRHWMRLIAMPVIEGNRVVRLHGLKMDISHAYR